jgi:alanine racemase
MRQSSFIELDYHSLKKNISYLKKRIGNETTFVSVIKSNAYGHGIKEFLPLAESCGVDYFAVFDASEAEIAFQVKKKSTRLMIMGYIADEDVEWVIENDISFFVFNESRLHLASLIAKKLNKQALIHLECETGLHRTGFQIEKIPELSDFIKNQDNCLFLEGLCSHLAGAESISNYVRVKEQIEKFNSFSKQIQSYGIEPKYKHLACSAAALTYADTRLNMVRFGIAQYGFWPSNETKMHNLLSDSTKFTQDPLQQILTWKTEIMNIATVEKGNFVGYGNGFMASKPTKIATVPIGYSQGYRRSLSNIGYVLIKGRKANIIGTVNMNMFLVDVTSIPDINIGDEVVLIGKQGKRRISVTSFSEMTNFINYELLSRIPANIPRKIKGWKK